MSKLIAITGGIGCGKSVVSEMLRVMGFRVYDCDSRAKMLMDADEVIKADIARLITRDAVTADGAIDRRVLASVVFGDKLMLSVLNGIVHEAVRRDIEAWRTQAGDAVMWVESAIIYESGIDKMVDAVWSVEAPLELRIARVMKRNCISREEVLSRIRMQQGELDGDHTCVMPIVNDDVAPLIPQVNGLLYIMGQA